MVRSQGTRTPVQPATLTFGLRLGILQCFGLLQERPERLELSLSAWKAVVLPLNYGRITVDNQGVEPCFSACKADVFPIKLVAHLSLTRVFYHTTLQSANPRHCELQ